MKDNKMQSFITLTMERHGAAGQSIATPVDAVVFLAEHPDHPGTLVTLDEGEKGRRTYHMVDDLLDVMKSIAYTGHPVSIDSLKRRRDEIR